MTDAPESEPIPADELQALWQAEPLEISPMILADVHKRAVRFETLQRWSIVAIAASTLFGFAMAGYVMMNSRDGLLNIGYSLMALGCLFVLYYMHTYRLTNPRALAGATQACLDFYRDVLRHKIRRVRTWWVWSLLPLLPGTLLILWRLGQILAMPHPRHNPKATITLAQATLILHGLEVFLVVYLLILALVQFVRARRLKRELQSLTKGVEKP